ncbi:MAG TPA: hypothetical protein PLG04_00275 [Anaerolineaceae bacterium]|jgi:hypothetical protein|nr:hypothetical protein [Anaerolineaceae bacterium]
MTLDQLASILDCADAPERLFLRAEVIVNPHDLMVYISPIASMRFGATTGYMVWGFAPEIGSKLYVVVYAMVLIDDIKPVKELANSLTQHDMARLLKVNSDEMAVAR